MIPRLPLAVLGLLLLSNAPAATVTGLRCEYLENPLGVEASQPRLSWLMHSDVRGDRQRSYQVRVASTPELLRSGRADLWDSAEVQSDETMNIAYAGVPIASGRRCSWQVRINDSEGTWSPWSEPATWSMGLLEEKDWHAAWIGAEDAPPAPPRHFWRGGDRKLAALTPDEAPALLLRKEIMLKAQPVRVTAYVCGLGYFELYLNGRRVGDHVMDPVFTNYARRASYVTFDLTSLVNGGSNTLGVILGNGFYNLVTPDKFQLEKADWRTPPRLRLELVAEFADGSVQQLGTDGSWKWRTGPIRFNCIRGGETIDSRIDPGAWTETSFGAGPEWRPVKLVTPRPAELSSQLAPPMRVRQTFAPVAITEPKPGVWLVDFGRNLTGWARYEASGAAGRRVTLDFNEELRPDGTLNTGTSAGHTFGRFQRGELILSGGTGPDVFEPRFTYHGFRYVQITGAPRRPEPAEIQAKLVHTDLADAGSFACSNPRLNQLHAAAVRTLLDCVHGMPAEEPTREKMGWTFDAANTMEAYVFNFDARAIYRKYVQDLIDTQEPSGHVPPIAPTHGWGYLGRDGEFEFCDDPWWGGTLAIIVDRLYNYYGDREALATAYEPMKRYVDWMATTAQDRCVLTWSLGDWLEQQDDPANMMSPDKQRATPVPVTSGAGYYHLTSLLARHAGILGKSDDATRYARLAEEIRTAYNAKFLDAGGRYAPDSQTAQSVPLHVGLVPAERQAQVRANLRANFEQHGRHLTTGFIGVMPTLDELSAADPELAYAAVTQEQGSGWLYAVKDDTTTLGENIHPQGYGTQHHPFAACVDAWFYRTLAGIQPDPAAPGFSHFTVKPGVVKDLTWVTARYDSVRGQIAVDWQRNAGRFTLDVTVPANATATIHVPNHTGASVTVSGRPASDVAGVKFLRMEDRRAVFAVAGGTYHFAAPDSPD